MLALAGNEATLEQGLDGGRACGRRAQAAVFHRRSQLVIVHRIRKSPQVFYSVAQGTGRACLCSCDGLAAFSMRTRESPRCARGRLVFLASVSKLPSGAGPRSGVARRPARPRRPLSVCPSCPCLVLRVLATEAGHLLPPGLKAHPASGGKAVGRRGRCRDQRRLLCRRRTGLVLAP